MAQTNQPLGLIASMLDTNKESEQHSSGTLPTGEQSLELLRKEADEDFINLRFENLQISFVSIRIFLYD